MLNYARDFPLFNQEQGWYHLEEWRYVGIPEIGYKASLPSSKGGALNVIGSERGYTTAKHILQ